MIEVMIVVAILGIVMGMTTIALTTASAETAMSTTECALQNTTNQFLQRFVSELRNASRATVTFESNGAATADHGDCIKFRVPVDTTGPAGVPDGLVDLDANGDAVFGATLGRTHTKEVDIVYRFRANQVDGADEVLDEAQLGIDVNGDGDETDSFTRGLFARTAEGIGNEDARRASDRWFLYGDENGDGIEQPIFEQAGDGTITIRLLAADVMRRQKTPIRVLVTTSVRPFNE